MLPPTKAAQLDPSKLDATRGFLSTIIFTAQTQASNCQQPQPRCKTIQQHRAQAHLSRCPTSGFQATALPNFYGSRRSAGLHNIAYSAPRPSITKALTAPIGQSSRELHPLKPLVLSDVMKLHASRLDRPKVVLAAPHDYTDVHTHVEHVEEVFCCFLQA